MSRILVSLVALLATAASSATAITYSDGTFLDADWTGVKVVDTTASADATFVAVQVATNGNPDAYRRVEHGYGPGSIGIRHLRDDATYDPGALGAIATLDYSFDAIHLDPPTNQAVAFNILLFQSDSTYIAAGHNAFDAVWTPFGGAGLVAADFSLYAGTGPSNPDFSPSGGVITAGYATRNTNSGGATRITRLGGIDNWSVTFNPIPEPTAACLIGIGLAGLASLRPR